MGVETGDFAVGGFVPDDPIPFPTPALRAAARRLLPDAGGNAGVDRIAALAVRLLGVGSAQVSLLTDAQHVVAGAGLPAGTIGSSGALADSLCTVTVATSGPLAIPDARTDGRVSALPPVASGQVVAYLGVPLVADSGAMVGVLCVFDPAPHEWTEGDLTVLSHLADSVRAELELAALSRDYDTSRARWDLAVQAGDIGSFDWELSTGALGWDDRMIALYGYDQGEVGFDRTIASVNARVHPDDLDQVTTAMADAIAQVGPLHVRYRVVIPAETGGSIRWLEARGRALPGPGGTAARLLGVSWDVTDQQNAQTRAERVLGAMSVGFLSLDPDGRITYVNTEGLRLLGHQPGELVDRTVWDVFPGTVDSQLGRAIREVATTRQPQTLESFYPAPLNAWYEVRIVPHDGGVALYFLDISARRSTQELLELSVDVSEKLVGAVDVDEAVAAVAQLVVPRLADWSIVTLAERDGRIRDVYTWHRDPALRPLAAQFGATRMIGGGTGVTQEATATGRVQSFPEGATQFGLATLSSPEARAALTELAPESSVVVPMLAGGIVAGAVTFARGATRAPMSDQELGVALSICRRAGLAIDNARLYAAAADAAAHDRTIAQALQQALLTRLPEPDHLHLTARYLPAADGDQVGGDWYDALIQPGGSTTVMIGDVVGHDIAAAAVMGQLRTMLRLLALQYDDTPAQILQRLDQAAHALHVDTLATVAVARIEQTAADEARDLRTLRWANAGHPPPVLLLADGTTTVLDGGGASGVAGGGASSTPSADILIGVLPGYPRHDHTHPLPPDSTLLLYTDGLIETRTSDLDDGIARLRATLTRHHLLGLDAMLDAVLADLIGENADDDIAVLAVRLGSERRPRPPEAGPAHR